VTSGAAGLSRVDREELILEAVLNLLAQHGIASISMRAVAREAGVVLAWLATTSWTK
jgi:AcrR family transcriptional regulator